VAEGSGGAVQIEVEGSLRGEWQAAWKQCQPKKSSNI